MHSVKPQTSIQLHMLHKPPERFFVPSTCSFALECCRVSRAGCFQQVDEINERRAYGIAIQCKVINLLPCAAIRQIILHCTHGNIQSAMFCAKISKYDTFYVL